VWFITTLLGIVANAVLEMVWTVIDKNKLVNVLQVLGILSKEKSRRAMRVCYYASFDHINVMLVLW